MLILFPVLYIIVLPILDKSFDSTGRSITELTLYCVLPSILLIKIFHTKVIHINTIDILSLFLFVWGCFKVIFSSIPTDFSSVSILFVAFVVVTQKIVSALLLKHVEFVVNKMDANAQSAQIAEK